MNYTDLKVLSPKFQDPSSKRKQVLSPKRKKKKYVHYYCHSKRSKVSPCTNIGRYYRGALYFATLLSE